MKLKEVVEKSQSKYQQAKEQEAAKRKLRPLSVSVFYQEFKDKFRAVYEQMVEPTADTYKKLNGLVRMLAKNGLYCGQDAHDFIEWLFDNWTELDQKSAQTNNRKKYTLAVRPDLKDIVNCRDYFLQEYFKPELECNEEEELDLLEMWRKGE